MKLQSVILSTEPLRLNVSKMFEQKFKQIKVESNRKFYKCIVVSGLDLNSSLNYFDSMDTHSSVVESWTKGFWFISAQFFTLLFISNRKDMASNPVYSKSVNSVCPNKKLSHLSSLLQYNYLTKNQSFIFLCKIFLQQK